MPGNATGDTMTPSLSSWFDSLPPPLRTLLSVGSVGKLHLLDAAAQGLAHAAGRPDLVATGADMVMAALGDTPFSGDLAAKILATPALTTELSEEGRTLLRTVVRHWNRPENLSYFQRIVSQRDLKKLKTYLETQISREPENLFWREQAANVGMYEADYDWLTSCFADAFARDLGPLHAAFMGQIASARGNLAGALECCRATGDLFGKGWTALHQARILLAQNEDQEGLDKLFEALGHSPWLTQAALRAFDLLQGLHDKLAPLPGKVAVLLYSWNKAKDLDATLQTLFDSDLDKDLGHVTIYALNNGATDTTQAVLASWQQRFTPARMQVVDLPVNIGAAAARNWLMHLPEVRQSDWVVYLDDDALVPQDWLGRFGAAAQAYPEAGVWGCKVVDAAQPALLQSVDYHLQPVAEPQAVNLSSITPHLINLSNLHVQVLDNGQFDFMRPCASVTGCCHLFSTKRLHETGDFSLYLSPSQYDDLERDLRMLAGGRLGSYQGHLRVLHQKRTGRASLVETTQEANAIGNRYKMATMHEPEEIAASTALEQETLVSDLAAKLQRLDRELGQRKR